MPTGKKMQSLGDFMDEVTLQRDRWRLREDKELWFRGESREYRHILRPELYRPRQDPLSGDDLSLKPISELLKIENDLYEDFQRCAVQLSDEKKEDEDWEWDSYFLMQHHGGPTRLLDWSDGALMALHFAVRNKKNDSCDAHVYVLEPYRLMERLAALTDVEFLKQNWKAYVERHPSYRLSEDEWEDSYLPAKEEEPGGVVCDGTAPRFRLSPHHTAGGRPTKPIHCFWNRPGLAGQGDSQTRLLHRGNHYRLYFTAQNQTAVER